MLQPTKFGMAFGITIIYLVCGLLWIFLSDYYLKAHFSGQEELITLYQTYKGWVFVLLTSVLIFGLSLYMLRLQARILKQLAQSENKFRTLVEQSLTGVYIIQDGCFVYVNPQFALIFGYSRHDLLTGVPFRQLVAERDRALVSDTIRKRIDGEIESARYAFRGQRKDGAIINVEVHGVRMEWQGRPAVMGTLLDISERLELLHKEDQLKDQLRLALEAGNIGLWDWDLASNEVDYSPEWKRQIGYHENEIGNGVDEWSNRLHPQDAQTILDSIQAVINGEVSQFYGEFRFLHKDGSYRWMLARGDIRYDNAHQPVRFQGSHTDITRLKAAQETVRESEARMSHLLAANPTVLFVLEVTGHTLSPSWASDNVTRITGYSKDEVLQPDFWIDHLHPQDRQIIDEFREELQEQEELSYQYRFLHKNGNYIWVLDELRVLNREDRRITHYISSWSDITRRKREEEQLTLYGKAFQSVNDGIVITSPEGDILSVNRAFMNMSGYDETEVLGTNPRILQSGKHGRDFYVAMWDALLKTGHWQGEIWNRRKDGEIYPEWLSISRVQDSQGKPTHYVAISTDISNLKKSQSEIERLSHYDVLTDLPNRLLIYSRLEHAIERVSRQRGHMVALLQINIADFKKVNDSLGHSIGDKLIREFSRRLVRRSRSEDTLGRLGGDEFLLILEDIQDTGHIITVVDAILHSLDAPFPVTDTHNIQIEVYVGISVYPEDATTTDVLLRQADTAVHKAKQIGRNRYCFFTEELGKQVMEYLDLEIALREGLKNEEFLLHYQPKLDLQSGKITGAEALIRWRRSDDTLVAPARFIPVAEATGLISPIGEWVINHVCFQLREWLDRGLRPVQIAVNVSARQFELQPLVQIVRQALTRYNLPPKLLNIEITESVLMKDPERSIKVLQELREFGVQVSLDDFGTGFSSLSYLNRLPLDFLKIDASFVQTIGKDKAVLPIIDSTIDLARNIHLRSVAEGVETDQQKTYLKDRGCDEMQGYLFSKPVSAKEFEQFIALRTQ